MSDDTTLLVRLKKAESLLEEVLEENRQWRVTVLSVLEHDLELANKIFNRVRDGGIPDEFIEAHLFQIARDRDRWKQRALLAEDQLRKPK